MLAIIDEGKGQGGKKRFWTLDPIDGTKGFLRGDQYAVCLALVDQGQVKVAAMACPNLPSQSDKVGVVYSAVRGQGAFKQGLNEGAETSAVKVSTVADFSSAYFCESVETGHSNHGMSQGIATKLGIVKPSVRMDSQCKYGLLAEGGADIYLRFPTQVGYAEKIWVSFTWRIQLFHS
jgi:3'(2'), 5'-bisphosphate nucleotidase